jgi:hypothetical protein
VAEVLDVRVALVVLMMLAVALRVVVIAVAGVVPFVVTEGFAVPNTFPVLKAELSHASVSLLGGEAAMVKFRTASSIVVSVLKSSMPSVTTVSSSRVVAVPSSVAVSGDFG